MFSARSISVCDCLLAPRSFGVAVVVDGGWELLMVCVCYFSWFLYIFGWSGSVCVLGCVYDCVS